MPTGPYLAPERDEHAPHGRAKRSGETYLTIPGVPIISATTTTILANTDMYSPWWTDTPIVIDELVAEVTTGAGTNFRIGFYNADRDWQPIGSPMADSGNLDGSTTGVKTYTPGTPIFVPRGRYVSVINGDSGSTAFRIARCGMVAIDSTLGAAPFISSLTVGRALAAFPTPGTAWTTEANPGTTPHFHFFFYRVLAP